MSIRAASRRLYPPKNRKCVAWATRIDKQPWFVWHWPHGFSAVWPVPHEPRLFVNPCGWRSISSKFGGSPRRKVSILYPCSLETILDDFTLQKTVNVLPGPHGLTNSLGSCGTGHTGFRRCGQCHTNQGCLSIRVAGAAFRANLEGPPAEKYRFCTRAASRRF